MTVGCFKIIKALFSVYLDKYVYKNKVNRTTESHFLSPNHHKWLPYEILGNKTVKNVQIDPQTTEI